MNKITSPSFGPLRSFFWPVHSSELKKVLPMFFLFLLISFVYNLMRCLKITLVVTAPGAGPEVIPFLKIFFVLPGALVLVHLFTKFSNKYSREGIFYAMLSIFLVSFAAFLFIFYPFKDFWFLDSVMQLADWKYFPSGMQGLLVTIKNWPFSLFYALCELWGTVVLCMLFWGFANEVTPMEEATRFYAVYTLAANLSGIFSGCLGTLGRIHTPVKYLPYSTAWEQTLFVQVALVLVIGLIIVSLFKWINTKVYINDYASSKLNAKEKDNEKISLISCLKYLFYSRYISYIVILVVSYNLVYNLADVLLAKSAGQLYLHSEEINAFMNTISILTGFLAVLFALFISGNIVRFYGWSFGAMIPPLVWLLTVTGFFACLFSSGDSWLGKMITYLFSSPLHLAVYFGAAQICLGRSTKYTVFDETKELAFIPLSANEQRKGKAVVDGFVSRLGKSSGSLVILILLSVFGNIMSATPYIAAIMFIAIGLWMFAVIKLGKLVNIAIKPKTGPNPKKEYNQQNVDSEIVLA